LLIVTPTPAALTYARGPFGVCRQLQLKLVAAEANDIAIIILRLRRVSVSPFTVTCPSPIRSFASPAGAGHAFKFEDFVELYRFFLNVDCMHALLQQAVALNKNGLVFRGGSV
jgi:hypothetical protein